MPADLPPTTHFTDTVNAVASGLGVNRPELLDRADGLLTNRHARACLGLRLDVGHETALALRTHVRADDGNA